MSDEFDKQAERVLFALGIRGQLTVLVISNAFRQAYADGAASLRQDNADCIYEMEVARKERDAALSELANFKASLNAHERSRLAVIAERDVAEATRDAALDALDAARIEAERERTFRHQAEAGRASALAERDEALKAVAAVRARTIDHWYSDAIEKMQRERDEAIKAMADERGERDAMRDERNKALAALRVYVALADVVADDLSDATSPRVVDALVAIIETK